MFNTNAITHIPAGDIPYKPKNHNEMCGEVEAEQNDDIPDSPSTRAGYVRFKMVHGLKKDAPSIEIKPGDRIYIPENVWHRHGAQKGQTRVHLAITNGETEWDEEDRCE